MVLEAVCILLNKKPEWGTAKILMQDINRFLDNLKNYNKDNIPSKIVN